MQVQFFLEAIHTEMAAPNREAEDKRIGQVTARQAAEGKRVAVEPHDRASIASTVRRHSVWTAKRRMSRRMSRKSVAEQIPVSNYLVCSLISVHRNFGLSEP